jgi:hypothetical protein
MEPEGSLPRNLYWTLVLSEINLIHSILSYLSKIHFNIVRQPRCWSCQWSVSCAGCKHSETNDCFWCNKLICASECVPVSGQCCYLAWILGTIDE